jgi:hypothetical protein
LKVAKKAIKDGLKKVANHVDNKATKAIAKTVKRSAVRHIVVAVHKVAAVHKKKASATLQKLRVVGEKVSKQITKEALHAHKSRAVAAKEGAEAGAAAVTFAGILIKKKLVVKVGVK